MTQLRGAAGDLDDGRLVLKCRCREGNQTSPEMVKNKVMPDLPEEQEWEEF